MRLYNYPIGKLIIKGVGLTVEIDESFFTHSKNNASFTNKRCFEEFFVKQRNVVNVSEILSL